VKKLTLRHYVLAGLLGAMIAALGFTPFGMVPVPTPAGSATILHIPVIIAALIEGPLFGSLVGLMFGAVSYWRAVVAPANPMAQMMFIDPFTALVPRILIGVLSYIAFRVAHNEIWRRVICAATGFLVWDLSYRTALHLQWVGSSPATYLFFMPLGAGVAYFLLRLLAGEDAPVIAAALAGSLTNTVGVMTLVTLRGILPASASAVVAVVHGLPEAAVAVVITLLVYRSLSRRLAHEGG